MKIINRFLSLLTVNERKKSILLLLLIILMAIFDTMGVASILPFVTILTNPDIVESNFILNKIFEASKIFGVDTNHDFLVFFGILVFFLLVFSLSFKAFTTYVQVRFVHMCEHSISRRLIENYLHQPYHWFINHHSADIGKNILSEINQVIQNGMKPLMELISKSLITISIITFLILVNPKITIMVSFFIGGVYAFIYVLLRRYLDKIGNERLKNNESRFTIVSEAFGAIKEIKVNGLEEVYIDRFSAPSQSYAKNLAISTILSLLPRYLIEAIAFGGVTLILLYLMTKTGNLSSALPILSLYVFAGYRLLPAITQVYTSLVRIRFIQPALEVLNRDIKNVKKPVLNSFKNNLVLKKSIILKNIDYSYDGNSPLKNTLKNFNLVIPAYKTIGLIGKTGSGKTTVVDIILGLLEVKKGTFEIDGEIITKKNIRTWQQTTGYVPQNIYLSDDTIAANIAFGVSKDDINLNAIENASKKANLHEFIKNELPNKYKTLVGERGIRLSGGQRQRIGIARALYRNPQLLVLDEATSALDDETEKAVIDAIDNLNNKITIILIAHRLNTIKNCDIVYKLDKGRIVS